MPTKPNPTTIAVKYPLSGLVESCEQRCVASCCGIDAFDFSPLFIAAFLSAGNPTGNPKFMKDAVNDLLSQLRGIRDQYCCEPLQDIDYTLVIDQMNQMFTTRGLSVFLSEIEYNIGKAPEVLALSYALRQTNAEQGDGGERDK